MDQPTQHIPRPGPPPPPPPAEGATQHIPRPEPQQISPTEPPPPGGPKPTKTKRSFLRDPLSIVLIVIIVLALAAAGLAGAELYARHVADGKVASATECVTKDSATVSFSAMPPFLWQHVRGDYQNLRITTAGNKLKRAEGMKADISIHDVRLEGGKYGAGTIGALNATITWPGDGIKKTVQEAIPVLGNLVTSVKTSAPDKTIQLQGTFGSIVAKPQVTNRDLTLQVMSVSALGFDLPPETVQSTLNGLTDRLAQNYPLNIRPDSVDVTDSSVVGHFSTTGADIPKPDPNDPDSVCFSNL
jgi:LmeA-like phospholipid-binding